MNQRNDISKLIWWNIDEMTFDISWYTHCTWSCQSYKNHQKLKNKKWMKKFYQQITTHEVEIFKITSCDFNERREGWMINTFGQLL